MLLGEYTDATYISSIPVSGGASGSGVFHKNKVVGILVMVIIGYDHSGIFVRLDKCRDLYEFTIANWRG
jgi:hypothetical protein